MEQKKENKNKEMIETHTFPVDNVIDPNEIVLFGTNAAKVLKDVVEKANLVVNIKGNEYMMFEGWQTVAKFFNASVGIEWTKPLYDPVGELEGFEARAYVKDEKGNIISNAESYCGKDEDSWKNQKNYAIRSMAQTRASAKALRQCFSWVVVLAGYKPTPLEEMSDIIDIKPSNKKEILKFEQGILCSCCNKTPLTERVYKFSMEKEGEALCYTCQKLSKEERDKKRNKVIINDVEPDKTVHNIDQI